jgi:hypothetical protein
MKERSIRFFGEQIRAIIDGKKTQERRIIKMVHRKDCPWKRDDNDREPYEWVETGDENSGHDYSSPCRCIIHNCPYGEAGDMLWVKESFQIGHLKHEKSKEFTLLCATGDSDRDGTIFYAADDITRAPTWRPSIHMPRWASRITLKIESICVERLHDISEEDAQAEGLLPITGNPPRIVCNTPIDMNPTARELYKISWDGGNAKRGFDWDSNPYVWVIKFKRVQ